jgi:hypothetical protein
MSVGRLFHRRAAECLKARADKKFESCMGKVVAEKTNVNRNWYLAVDEITQI